MSALTDPPPRPPKDAADHTLRRRYLAWRAKRTTPAILAAEERVLIAWLCRLGGRSYPEATQEDARGFLRAYGTTPSRRIRTAWVDRWLLWCGDGLTDPIRATAGDAAAFADDWPHSTEAVRQTRIHVRRWHAWLRALGQPAGDPFAAVRVPCPYHGRHKPRPA